MNIKVIKTIKGQKPMQEVPGFEILDNNERENELVCVFPDIEYQEIRGFGGAFTEAASTTLDKLSPQNREKILRMYFDPEEGILTAAISHWETIPVLKKVTKLLKHLMLKGTKSRLFQ